ncbi:MAG: hypothetical protein ACSLFQ_12335, partial [Thermoanaerobaculia bacterium]
PNSRWFSFHPKRRSSTSPGCNAHFARVSVAGARTEPGVFASLDRQATFWHRSAVQVGEWPHIASHTALPPVTVTPDMRRLEVQAGVRAGGLPGGE